METQKIQIGGYVRILKDGQYDNVSFKKGEIWRIKGSHTSNAYLVEREGNETIVIVDNDDTKYGNESTYIGMEGPIETYNIY